MQIQVRVTPRSSRMKAEYRDSVLYVWVMAAPTDGQANEAVRRYLADLLDLPPSRIELVRGQASRQKVFAIEAEESVILARLAQLGG